jgi:hypothetical protein
VKSFYDIGMIGQSQVIVAAKGQQGFTVNINAHILRACDDAARTVGLLFAPGGQG